MAKSTPDPEREERIANEIVVDAYDAAERAMGWYYYLQHQLQFPFTARCIAQRAISPLQLKDEVEVIALAPEQECSHELFVMIRWNPAGLAVPLMQLKPTGATDDETQQAVADWHYWVSLGREF